MKKLIPVLLMAVSLFTFNQAAAKKDDIIKGGPFISAGAFMPASVYGYPNSFTTSYGYTTGATFQFGHAFSMGVFSPGAVSMRVTWLEGAGALDNDKNFKGYTFYASILKIGPQASFKFSEEMAVHAYGQIAPTVMVNGEFGNSNAISAVGLTNSIGAEFEWKKLTLGAEISSGRLLDNDARGSGPYANWTDDQKELLRYRSSNFKLMIGLQFGKPK